MKSLPPCAISLLKTVVSNVKCCFGSIARTCYHKPFPETALAAILFDLGGTYLRCAVGFNCASVSSSSLAHRQKCLVPNFLTSSSQDAVWEGLLQLICGYVTAVNG